MVTCFQPPCGLDSQGRHLFLCAGKWGGGGRDIPRDVGSEHQAPEANTASGLGGAEG